VEQKAFDDICLALKELPNSSQYKILKELAHRMDREVHKLGAVRSAISVGAATARRIVPRDPKGRAKAKGFGPKDQDPLVKEFYELPETKALDAKRQELKESLKNKVEDSAEFVSIKKQITECSLKLRTRLQSFRSSKKNEVTDEKTN
jgi:hypothetical protein